MTRFTVAAAAVVVALLAVVLPHAHAHQSISYPWPMSRMNACRMGKFKNCPGPCPNDEIRADQSPNYPSITVSRNAFVTINTKRNNHAGGFSRWSIVNVDDMNDRTAHDREAFLWTCADLNKQRCDTINYDRDCSFDGKSSFYQHEVQIPPVYSDGVYVLGWAWYGGTQGHGRGGDFGDYYDCMYVNIEGGDTSDSYAPKFEPGPSDTARDGKCAARTNRLGDCVSEPCNGRRAGHMLPREFEGGSPQLLQSRRFSGYQIERPPATAPAVYGISIREANDPSTVYASSTDGPIAQIRLNGQSITVTCDVEGDVDKVEFYKHGEDLMETDTTAPYSIAGEYTVDGGSEYRYKPMRYKREDDIYLLSCGVYGKDGSVQWARLEVWQTK
ncbi:unnamed protein product [Agarophyton chilense]|eukprot:gb/GEZJ01006555.1/.p1 GENE.gb/GEZJ01006555.1/~~gb/GEZJ01006555.1/.p1  ORF type:complete len:386 (-),score=42.59 gb/GEZJ01006555.1/:166-1323(-)